MQTTTNLNLTLTENTAEDLAQTFQTWRNKMDGTASTSNMQRIDAAFGTVVEVSDTQPSDDTNKIWVKPEGDEYRVASWEEYAGLNSGNITFPSEGTYKYYNIAGTTANPVNIGDVIGGPITAANVHFIITVGDLIEGETFKITAHDGASARPWAILDKDMMLRSRASGASVSNATVTVPAGCAGGTLIVQVRDTYIAEASVVRNTNFATISTLATDINRLIRREKGTIYLGNGATVDITSGGSGSIVASFYGRLNFKLLGDNGGVKDWADISSELTESQITIEDNTAVITIPNYYWLVYNTDDQQLHLRSNNGSGNYALLVNDVVLLYNAYNQPVFGILHEKWLDQQAREASTRLDAAESAIEALEGATDVSETLATVAGLLNSSNPEDCFLYFTDPHLKENSVSDTRYKTWMNLLRSYANQLPVSFAVCGGDWIGNSDTPEAAMQKLAAAHSTMKQSFKEFYMVLGNHDTNYQGTAKLSQQANNNLWYGGGKSYFTFETNNAMYVVLDTGVENSNFHNSNNNSYYAEEAAWLVETLKANTKEHVVFLQHIAYSTWSSLTVSTIADGFTRIANAYNTATNNAPVTVTIQTASGNVNYTFNAVPAGHVDLCIAGHSHHDGTGTLNSIPCAVRTSMRYEGKDATSQPVFDIVTIDFTGGVAHFTRVGERGDSLDFTF